MKNIKKVPKPRKPYVKNLVGSKITHTPLEVKEIAVRSEGTRRNSRNNESEGTSCGHVSGDVFK